MTTNRGQSTCSSKNSLFNIAIKTVSNVLFPKNILILMLMFCLYCPLLIKLLKIDKFSTDSRLL